MDQRNRISINRLNEGFNIDDQVMRGFLEQYVSFKWWVLGTNFASSLFMSSSHAEGSFWGLLEASRLRVTSNDRDGELLWHPVIFTKARRNRGI